MGKFFFLLLALISTVCADLPLIPQHLSLDGLIWYYGLFSRGGAKGWFTNQFNFQHRQATVGLTGKITPIATTQIKFDFSQLTLQDLAVEFNWPNGLGLKLGQFKLPLSFNSEIEEKKLTLEEYSILYYTNILKPSNIRDIGTILWYGKGNPEEPDFRAIAGIVNGTGPNSGDNNLAKDLFVRVMIKPGFPASLSLGGRFYYGWTQREAVPWLGAGFELKFKQGPILISPEFALRRHQNLNVAAGDFKIETGLHPLSPAIGWQIIRWENGQFQWRVLPAINLLPHERLKILIGYQYHSLINVWEYQGLVLRLMAII